MIVDDPVADMSQEDVAEKCDVTEASVGRWAKTLREAGRDAVLGR